MKQLLQNARTGELRLEDVPAPALQPGGVVVRNHYSLVSAGTERATLTFARQSLLGKARSRPDLVRQVITKVRTDGLIPTYHAVMQRLSTFTPLGYSSAGEVLEIGEQVDNASVGDLVSCAGAGYASHAEIVYVPKNLIARLPHGISARPGAFATLGAIALQGIRRADLTPGERVAVIGLGLVGQLTVQLLHAYGFPALGLDVDPGQVERAARWGLERTCVIGRDDPEALAQAFSDGNGVDAVIITAATASSDPIALAGRLLRERGRVSVVGDVGMNVPRRIYYERELDVRVSRSYGPGRYDPSYEEQGIDYPVAYARWTEQRNMQEFLRLVAAGRVDVDGMVTHTFPLERVQDAYQLILNNPANETFLGVLLEYSQVQESIKRRVSLETPSVQARKAAAVQVGLIGGGSFAQGTILPALAKLDRVRVKAIATATGTSASSLAKTYGCSYATTNYRDLLEDEEINLVVIATRHGLHACMGTEALRAGKDVFVEKPLALTVDELRAVVEAAKESPGRLMVGFNRRFAPMTAQIKDHFRNRSTPLMVHCRVNAGLVPPDSWVHDPVEGGGRILGEVCHFVDLAHFLVGAPPQSVYATRLPAQGDHVMGDDNVLIAMEFADGSRVGILYSALAAESMPKELLEVMGDGRASTLDNFRSLSLYQGSRRKIHTSRQDKGHEAGFRAVVDSILRGEAAPIPLDELVLSSLATLCIVQSLKEGGPVSVDLDLLAGGPSQQPESSSEGEHNLG